MSLRVSPGVLLVDKPVGLTSHDVVASARRALGERRIGHTGTLDPFASGLLLLCVGKATRLAEYLAGMDKTYEATACLGVTTDSGDLHGVVTETSEGWRALDRAFLESVLASFLGAIEQVPPPLSAKKVGGVPAHRRVRRGEEVALPPQTVIVHELAVTRFALPCVELRVRCSSGTYLRSLARDVGRALGVGAHLTALRRTATGPFVVADAVPPALLGTPACARGAFLSPLEALGHLPRCAVDAPAAAAVAHGRPVEVEGAADLPVAVAVCADRLVAVGSVASGLFRPRKVLAHG